MIAAREAPRIRGCTGPGIRGRSRHGARRCAARRLVQRVLPPPLDEGGPVRGGGEPFDEREFSRRRAVVVRSSGEMLVLSSPPRIACSGSCFGIRPEVASRTASGAMLCRSSGSRGVRSTSRTWRGGRRAKVESSPGAPAITRVAARRAYGGTSRVRRRGRRLEPCRGPKRGFAARNRLHGARPPRARA